MVLFYDWIFEEALYKQEALRFDLRPRTRSRAERALDLLQRAWKQNRLKTAGRFLINEGKAIQAFNKLVFQEMLGFTDLMVDEPTYSVLPEMSFSGTVDAVTFKGRADLGIGDFSESRADVVAVVELKSPGADITKAQRQGGYKSDITGLQMSAVDQAIEAMKAAECEWAIVSNLKQICLLHSSDDQHALTYDLTTLDTDGLRDFCFAFSPGGFYPNDQRGSRLQSLRNRSRRLAR